MGPKDQLATDYLSVVRHCYHLMFRHLTHKHNHTTLKHTPHTHTHSYQLKLSVVIEWMPCIKGCIVSGLESLTHQGPGPRKDMTLVSCNNFKLKIYFLNTCQFYICRIVLKLSDNYNRYLQDTFYYLFHLPAASFLQCLYFSFIQWQALSGTKHVRL